MAIRHKHFRLEQTKLDRARRLLGAKTETETVEHALDVVLGEGPVLRAHRQLKGVGGFVDVFGRAR